MWLGIFGLCAFLVGAFILIEGLYLSLETVKGMLRRVFVLDAWVLEPSPHLHSHTWPSICEWARHSCR